MDIADMVRPKTIEGATSNLAAYLINHQPTPNDPMVQAHRGALESLAILGDKLTPSKEKKAHQGSGSKHRSKDARDDITQSRSTKLATGVLQGKAITATIPKKPRSTMVNFEVPIA
jgi:hypothetical protein